MSHHYTDKMLKGNFWKRTLLLLNNIISLNNKGLLWTEGVNVNKSKTVYLKFFI